MLSTREPVSTLSHGPLVTVSAAVTLRFAAHQLYQDTIGALAVVEDDEVVGVITERDLVDALARGADPDTATVAQHLTTPVVTARMTDPVLDVALQMVDGGIRHIPLLDDLGHPQGMVSLRDLIRPLILQAMTPPERRPEGAASA